MHYHVTHQANISSIGLTGLDRDRSTGRAKRVWMVDEDTLSWALNHVCERHGWLAHEIVVFPIDTTGVPVRRGPRTGLYYSPESISPRHLLCPFQVHRVSLVAVWADIADHRIADRD